MHPSISRAHQFDDQVGGDLVALHLLKQVMYHERMRLP